MGRWGGGGKSGAELVEKVFVYGEASWHCTSQEGSESESENGALKGEGYVGSKRATTGERGGKKK